MADSNDVAGNIEGILIFQNIPTMAQMIGGKHTETGVEGGKPLLDGLPLPTCIVGDLLDPVSEAAK